METWETGKGIRFLRKVGVRKRHSVLDCGCGIGRYSMPAALLVGDEGVVYAVDKDKAVLQMLKEKAEAFHLSQIKILQVTRCFELNIPAGSIDVALLYDILHYMDSEDRRKIYDETRRLLTPGGLLSVYPKHIVTDHPLDHFCTMSEDDIRSEIESRGFLFKAKLCGTLSHDIGLNKGCILNFKQSER
ncbi:class I SAM-dependent methyltransferase [bacterium]|nr:class I SAM-dependent methyltransferase [candidate division CSSED10-310 bacterium]